MYIIRTIGLRKHNMPRVAVVARVPYASGGDASGGLVSGGLVVTSPPDAYRADYYCMSIS